MKLSSPLSQGAGKTGSLDYFEKEVTMKIGKGAKFFIFIFALVGLWSFLTFSQAFAVDSHEVVCPNCKKILKVRDNEKLIPKHKNYAGVDCPQAENPNYAKWKKAGGKDESDSYCFIATATYGSQSAGEVLTLRQFRDRYLSSTKAGRLIVHTYYKMSPSLAQVIEGSNVLKAISAATLFPIVILASFLLSLSYPFDLLFLALSCGLCSVAVLKGFSYARKLREG